MKNVFEPWVPPFRYREDFTDICDSRGQKMMDMRGWGYLTGRGVAALKMDEDKAAEIQDRIGNAVVSLLNAINASVEGGGMTEQDKEDHRAAHEAIRVRAIEAIRLLAVIDIQPSDLMPILQQAEDQHRELDFGWVRKAFLGKEEESEPNSKTNT